MMARGNRCCGLVHPRPHAAILVYVLGLPGLIPFAVAGAVVLDADTFFARAFDGRPSLYLFTHGGIAHSLAGAAVMALPAWAVAALVAPAVPFFPAVAAPLAFAAVLGGAYLHIGLDTLACPGLPLLAPRSDRKYTVGLLPGPSILLFGGQHRRPGPDGARRDLLAGHDPPLRRDHRRVPRRPARGVRPRPGVQLARRRAGRSRRINPSPVAGDRARRRRPGRSGSTGSGRARRSPRSIRNTGTRRRTRWPRTSRTRR